VLNTAKNAVSGAPVLSITYFSLPVSFILITRYGTYKIVGMPYRTGERPLRLRIVASRAPAMRVSIVVLAVALTCTRAVLLPLLQLLSCRAADLGLPWDVIGTSILFLK